MARPLIGLSGRRWSVDTLVGVPKALDGIEFDLHYAEYPAALAAAGGLPVELARDADVDDLLDRLDGLVVTGGADLDPATYGAMPEPGIGAVEPGRDAWEHALVDAALARHVPILGICRGAQLLNVHCGGTLRQDLAGDFGTTHARWDPPRAERCHLVVITPGTLAAQLYGSSALVNSLHHQAVDRVGEGLAVTGRTDDGVIEILEWPDRPEVFAVQWHPEALVDALDPAFGWVVEQARHYASARHAAGRHA